MNAELLSVDLRSVRTDNPPPVDGGMWYTENDKDKRGYPRCGICGDPDPQLVRDHCHTTGLVRGMICMSCNIGEGFHDSPRFVAWRPTAPMLEIGQREYYGYGTSYGYYTCVAGSEGFRHSTTEQLKSLPMAELLQRHADWLERAA